MSVVKKTVPANRSSDIIALFLFYFSTLGVLSFFLAGNVHEARAENSPDSSQLTHNLSGPAVVPARYGQVIYQHNATGNNHLYIVGISHRDTLTRSNGRNTAQVQTEVYRIGEWLIEKEGIELLLPEGYFITGKEKDQSPEKVGKSEQGALKTGSFAPGLLEERLAGSMYANAENLLMQSHRILVKQVEDDRLYNEVVAKIRMLGDKGQNAFEVLFQKLQLDYLQERRTAEILQKIPEIIDNQIRNGAMRYKNAMLTIGISHLSQIIASLNQNKLIVLSPAFTPFKDYVSEVNLLNEGFDITIIIPRTIADDGDLLSSTKLARYAGRFSGTTVGQREFIAE